MMYSTMQQIATQNGYTRPIVACSTELLKIFMICLGQENEIKEIT